MDTLLRLRQVSLFAGLTDADLALVELLVKRVRYAAGATVCRQGEVSDAFYIVDSGELQVLNVDARGVERIIDTLQPGQCFGETTLLLREPSKTTLRVTTEAELLAIPREDLNRLLNDHGDLRTRLLAGMSPETMRRFTRWQFPWLMPGEVSILVTRKHWWALLQGLAAPAGLTMVLVILALGVTALGMGMLPIVAAWALAFAVAVLASLYAGIDWRNDLYIVTNRRVVHLERVLLVRQERREAPIEKIQNVEVRQPTYFDKIIGMSDVVIATAAVGGTIVFATIPNGAGVRDRIFEQIQRAQALQMFEEHERLKQEIRVKLGRIPAPVSPPPQTRRPEGGERIRRPAKQVSGGLFALRIERDGTVTWRKHWTALAKQVWRPLILLLALLVVLWLSLIGTLPSFLPLLLSGLMVAMLGWVVWEWVDWRNDIYMVSQTRLVNLERNPLGVIKKSVEAPLIAVTNVSYRQPNLLAVALNIGDVLIETAGATGQLIFISMYQPSQVANEILQYVENVRGRQRQAQREQQRADFLDWLHAYHSFLEEEGVAKPPALQTPTPSSDSTLPPADNSVTR